MIIVLEYLNHVPLLVVTYLIRKFKLDPIPGSILCCRVGCHLTVFTKNEKIVIIKPDQSLIRHVVSHLSSPFILNR